RVAARETQYPPNNAACSSASHFGTNTMQPFFPMTNIDGCLIQLHWVKNFCPKAMIISTHSKPVQYVREEIQQDVD
ncbi:hypothetical protein OSTOST_25768, partial [Ostertagia ostertagi]